MTVQDCFVGCVAAALGLFCVLAPLAQTEWYFHLRKVERLEKRVGRRKTQAISIAIGLSLIWLGGVIAFG
jgi:hypothetical protein